MLSSILLTLALAGAAPPAEKVRVLVLEFKPSGGVQPDVAENITGLAAAILSEDTRLEVLAGPDLRQMIDLQAQKSEAGCDTDSASCIAELAGALDAKLVVIGNVGYLGKTLNTNIVLFDQSSGQNAGRRAVQANDLSDLAQSLREPLHALVAGVLGAAAAPPPEPGMSTGLMTAIAGGVALGVGAIALGVGAYPVLAINGERDNFVAGDKDALTRAIDLQQTWFDSGLDTAFVVGGAVLFVGGAGALAAGLVMGVE